MKKHIEAPFQIIYEDNHLLIVNKPAGMLVQGDKTGDEPIIELGKAYLKEKYDKPGNVFLGCVHRLDRPVSGVLVMAKTSKALERMNKLFQNKKIHKKYWAIVKRRPKEEKGKLTHWLKKDESINVTSAFDEEVPGSKRAELRYSVLGKLNDHYLLEVHPLTGRPHQIRVQLSAIGSPIRGDIKYGFSKPNEDGNINLHALGISFIHPVQNEKMYVRAGLPEVPFWEQFLGFDDPNLRYIDKV